MFAKLLAERRGERTPMLAVIKRHPPQAALIAESFTGRLRDSGSSLGYQLASIIAGGPADIGGEYG